MSWFYDALKKMEQEQAASTGKAAPAGDEETALLSSLASVISVADGNVKPAAPMSVELKKEHRTDANATVAADSIAIVPEMLPMGRFRPIALPRRQDSRLVFHADPHGLAAEQYRLLRHSLSSEFRSGATLMITSPGEGDGKTLTSLNLCACLADIGDTTLLVELDVRRPAVQRTLGCQLVGPGIEDALVGSVSPGDSIHFIEGLSFHAAMVMQPAKDPSRLINDKGVKQFLMWARQHFRWVVIDSAPVVPAADTTDLASLADAVLLVVRAHKTPRELCRRAFEMLGRRLHSVVLNEATVSSNPYYRYLGRYHQGPEGKAS